MSFYTRQGKRWFDLGLCVPGAVMLLPVGVLLALFVRMFLGSPVLFKQQRPGHNAAPFNLIKFRTMTDRRDHNGVLLPDADRLTSFGLFMRKSSLDELPTLWNVIQGEMSLVGPRPLLMQYLERYNEDQRRRHDVRPGVTGWAQVNGRNALSWEQKFELDVWYVDHVSLGFDLWILAKTFIGVLGRSGISAQGHATMPEFMGNGQDHV